MRCGGSLNAVWVVAAVVSALGTWAARAQEPDAPPPPRRPRFADQVAARSQGTERRWVLEFAGFITGGKNPLSVCARQRGDQWVAGVAMGIINKSNSWVDLSQAPVTNGAVKGPVRVHLTPDLWVPSKHLGFTVDLELEATVKMEGGDGTLEGRYKVVKVNSDDPSARQIGRGGQVTGSCGPYTPAPLPDPVTFTLNLQGSLVGGKPEYIERCMVLRLGFQGRTLASGFSGSLSPKGDMYGIADFPVQPGALTYDGDQIKGKVTIPTKTLDLTPCEYTFELDGRIVDNFVAGAFRETVKIEGGETLTRDGCFDGKWNAGIQTAETVDARPWWTPVKDFQPVQPGEHPRLLFRRSDLPALRKRAATPEGQAILASLRRSLNGDDGETMPRLYSAATRAYGGGGVKTDNDEPTGAGKAGVYTISHVAGYGFLYQITGDKKYAELGRQCFEKALAGTRDCDDRYSWRAPGGALRAGPSLGWYAVGYDLCYDGWDEATREKFGKAIEQYSEGQEKGDARANLTLESLVRGTMPPGSNHFGMQVGGAALALLAVMKEPFVGPKRIEAFLGISEKSMARNLTEGFGDGGFFAEGDGTGSMSSQIAYLSALQAWRNALGRDYANVERPNARMTALKWIYLTVIRGGHPDFWPIRGAYGHNVWARGGLSGGGYFGIGFSAVTEEQKAGMKWYYNHFLLQADEKRRGPYDTVSPYPHFIICAFVNWPFEMQERNPAEVLPLCYRDSLRSFYAWRNRWQDEDDIVISVLTKPTVGYMGAKPDGGLQVAAFGTKFKWGEVAGDVKHWWMSPRGQASVLTTAGGVSTAVDFTRASGADAMLVTTVKAEGETVKLGDQKLTFKFLTKGPPPALAVQGNKAVAGQQEVTLKDGNLVLSVSETK